MNDLQKEQVKRIIYTFTNLAGITDINQCNMVINKVCNMNEDDAIDFIIISINDLIDAGKLKKEDVFTNISLLTSLSSKYNTSDALISRLTWLKEMNITHPKMSLSENHKLVSDTFDQFNQLIGTNLDTYYTGGLIGYLATNHPLERYHSDIDMFINEAQLESLLEIVKASDDFEFTCNLDEKDEKGHEFSIRSKNGPMSIGLFLFERKPNNEIVIKNYYRKKDNSDLLVNEQHLCSEYASLVFGYDIRSHNGIPYRMQSLNSIYNSKKNGRPKDKYDAKIIKDEIDVMVDYYLDVKSKKNYINNAKVANNSYVAAVERMVTNLDSSPKLQ